MIVTKRTNSFLLTVVTIFLSVFLVVRFLEVDRAIAWIASSSWNNHHIRIIRTFVPPQIQKSKRSVFIIGATKREENPTEDNEASIKNDGKVGKRRHPSQHQRKEQKITRVESTNLEESFILQHNALETYLSDIDTDLSPGNDIPESSTQIIAGKAHVTEENEKKTKDTTSSSSIRSSQFFLRSIPYFLQSKGKGKQGFKSNKPQNTIENPEANESKEEHSQNDIPVPYFLRPKGSGSHKSSIYKGDSTSRSTPFFLQSVERNHQSRTNAKKKTIEKAAVLRLERERTLSATSTENQKKEGATIKTSVGNPKSASIDRVIYDFNTNLVGVLYAAISSLYPTSSPFKQQQDPRLTGASPLRSPLLGTEYNEDFASKTILRYEKFYIFETVARIPYFAYLSVLHLRESLGDRGFPPGTFGEGLGTDSEEQEYQQEQRQKHIEMMRTHYAQADNELHHLLIMESLGGNSRRIDRVVAHSLAFFYYWFVVLVFSWNEQAAYHLNEIVEDHAYKVYDEFLALHEDELRTLPVPDIARKYYETDYYKNPHLFEAFCAVSKSSEGNGGDPRKENRPHELNSLYDVFRNVRDDEKEHWMALCNLVQYDDLSAVEEHKAKSTEGN